MQLQGLDVCIFSGSPLEKMEEYPYASNCARNNTSTMSVSTIEYDSYMQPHLSSSTVNY